MAVLQSLFLSTKELLFNKSLLARSKMLFIIVTVDLGRVKRSLSLVEVSEVHLVQTIKGARRLS